MDKQPDTTPEGAPPVEQPGPSEAVGRLVSRGAAWMFGLNMGNRLLGLVRTAIIARLLAPNDLGLFGIALLAQSVIETVSMFGLTSALVRHPDDVDPYLDTAWIISFIRGLAVAVVLVVAAPLFARFFHQPGATNLIRIVATTSALVGFINPASIKLRRQLRFGMIFVTSLIPGLVDIGLSITIAVMYRTPLSLILGMVAKMFVTVVMSYWAVPYLPHLRYDRARAKELMSYGKWITGSTILRFLYGNGDDIVVGRLLGAASLGVYQIGYRYSNLPTTEITRVLQMVALPAYAKVQGNAARLRRAYVEALATTSLVSIAFAGYIYVITPDFVKLVLGPKWVGVIPVMRLLAVWGAAESVSEIPISLFEAVGKPQIETRRLLLKAVLLGALIYPFLHWWGLNGVCIAVLVSSLPALGWTLVNAARLAGATARDVFGALGVPTIGAGVAMAAAVGLGRVLSTGSVVSLVVVSLLCVGIYALIAVLAHVRGYTAVAQLGGRRKSSFARGGGRA